MRGKTSTIWWYLNLHLTIVLFVNNSEQTTTSNTNTSSFMSKDISNLERKSIGELYKQGVIDYLDNNYDSCITNLERAIGNFNDYMEKLGRCRLECKDQIKDVEPLHPVNIENLLFYEKAIKTTLCLLKCKKREDILEGWNLEDETRKLFEKRKPYEYLQACYAHNEQFQKAASAAFTYLVVNPNDSGVVLSLQYYTQQPNVDVNSIVNYEAKDYVYLYIHGTQAYEMKQWDEVIHNMESSLESLLHEDDECRAQCEGSYNQPVLDFIPSIANHFTHVLICKSKCNDKLSTLNGEKHDDLLPSHYHYLQYAYFKVGKLKEACQAVASYLLFYPNDKTMMHNMEYYKTLSKVKNNFFEPRQEAKDYIERETYEKKIINYIMDVFSVETSKLYEFNKKFLPSKEFIDEDDENKTFNERLPKQSKIKRFTKQDFITPEECSKLIRIANLYSVPGDGYQTGSGSPHTIHENYLGLSLKRASSLYQEHKMDVESLTMILNVTSWMKQSIEDHFDVTKRLHYAYTHLVCRQAKFDAGRNRTDFSHPVHADNCNIQVNGTCPKTWPAFTWRDYTAILYLNDDFAGGKLFFSKDYYGKEIEEEIQPTCGRLVGFTSGVENLHGVQAIREGTRCALAIWLTYDHKNLETERKLLYKLLLPNK